MPLISPKGFGKRLVLVVGRDPGGARALIPVVRLLSADDRLDLKVAASGVALEDFPRAGCDVDHVMCDDEPSLAALDPTPDLVFAATSMGANPEKLLVCGAIQRRIPLLAVIDQWTYFSARFRLDGASGPPEFLPTRIAVPDDFARDRMVAEGFPPECLAVTGHPGLRVAPTSSRRRQSGTRAVRLLFVSEARRADLGLVSGFDEQGAYEVTRLAALRVADLTGLSFEVWLRPHPREGHPTWFRKEETPHFKSRLAPSLEPMEIVAEADVVFGMVSILLVQAVLLGKPVVSVQPGLLGEDMLVSNRWGASRLATDERAAACHLREAVTGVWDQGLAGVPPVLIDGLAAERVAHEAYALLRLGPPGKSRRFAPIRS